MADDSFGSRDHDACRRAALETARALCARRRVRLTPIRKRTLELLWESQKPVGAYELMERLGAEGFSAHPPTVYRALDFLLEQNLAHKVLGASAFVGCARPEEPHSPRFLICERCGEMREFFDGALEGALDAAAAEADFAPRRVSVEIAGVCAPCRRASEPAGA